ncbi:MAG TPA: hypothetical protein VN603_06770 [Candidatus Acidoferrales bacterium]|nr:hypothetical protein [Candidatus Acidoferrales bacterium]
MERTAPLGQHPGTTAIQLRLQIAVLPAGAKTDRRLDVATFGFLAFVGMCVDRRSGYGRMLQLEAADRFGVTLRTVERWINKLRRLGYCRTEIRRRNACAEYQLLIPQANPSGPDIYVGSGPDMDDGFTRARRNNSTYDPGSRQVQTTLSSGVDSKPLDAGVVERVFQAFGGKPEFAQTLVDDAHGDVEFVLTWCSAIDFVHGVDNRAAWIRDALRKGYPLPKGYLAALKIAAAAATSPTSVADARRTTERTTAEKAEGFRKVREHVREKHGIAL